MPDCTNRIVRQSLILRSPDDLPEYDGEILVALWGAHEWEIVNVRENVGGPFTAEYKNTGDPADPSEWQWWADLREIGEVCPACRGEWWRYGAEGKKWESNKCPSPDCKPNGKHMHHWKRVGKAYTGLRFKLEFIVANTAASSGCMMRLVGPWIVFYGS